MAKPCCGEPVLIDGIYRPLCNTLVKYGMDAYKDVPSTPRVVMWVFSFFDAKKECPVCKHGLEEMYGWFGKHGLLENQSRAVRIVVDDDAEHSSILDDLHIDFVPVNIFTDGEGKIIDEIFEFPGEEWLERVILPFIQKDSHIL